MRAGIDFAGLPVQMLPQQQRVAGMSEIIIYAVEGRSTDQKRALVRDITDAVVRNLSVTADQVIIQIVESPKTSKARGGVLFRDRP